MRHYLNLSRGVLCPHTPEDIRYIRIQSTSCEQERWVDVLYGAGPDLLMALAEGDEVVVHDRSERDRETRACWQGLVFVRRTCEWEWGLPVTPIEGRGGVTMAEYFDEQIRELPFGVRRWVRYYEKYLATNVIDLRSCWGMPAEGQVAA